MMRINFKNFNFNVSIEMNRTKNKYKKTSRILI